MGIWTTITTTYTPPNHASVTSALVAALKYIHKQLALGHYSGPYSCNSLELLIGPFYTSLLGVIPKSNGSERIIQDLSTGDSKHPLVNSDISPNVFLTKWGLHKKVVPIVPQVPPGSLAATMDMDAAFCQCPVCPDQHNYFVVMWDGVFYLNHCVAFGGASTGGVFGHLANTFVAICRVRGMSLCTKWVNNFLFVAHLPLALSQLRYSLDNLIALGTQLGWPWKPLKMSPFNNVFTYLRFQWLLSWQTIDIPAAKKAKYLTCLAPWAAGGAPVSCCKAEIVLGTLVYCTLAVPNGCTQLVMLTHMVSAFKGAQNCFSCWTPSPAVLNNIAFWHTKLSAPFCGSVLCNLPPLSPVEFWVDALTSYGVGVVFAGHWAAWQFCAGWQADGHNIGWAKMIAIEVGVWVAVELGFCNTHFLVRSNNTGAIGLVSLGKAQNTEQNCSLQRIIAHMCASNLCIMSKYVALAANMADTPSCNVLAADHKPLLARIPIPPCFSMYLLDK
jgi:hypothetical protein